MKKLLFGLIAAIFSTLLCLVALEIAFRITGRSDGTDASFGPDFDRSQAIFYSDVARAHPWSQGDEPGLTIAVIGDSVTNGSGVQPDDSYGMRLERLLNLNEGLPPAEVHVFAKGGTSTFMQDGFLKQALAVEPDLILLGISLNDAEDWSEPETLKGWRQDLFPRKPPGWIAPLVRRFRLARWLHLRGEQPRINRAHIGYYDKLYDPAYSGHRKMVAAFKRFKARCDEAGVTFAAVVFPNLSWSLMEGQYPFQDIQTDTVRILRDLGIPTHDLFENYRGKSPDRLQVIPNIDGHPNEIGHRIAAEAVLAFLLGQDLIPRAYLPHSLAWTDREIWEWTTVKMRDPFAASKPAESDLDKIDHRYREWPGKF